ncbi:MAG: hypothetical protein AAGE84_31255, partial [Cyanobacteria bacterium P01_G01_bin.39]
NGNQTLPIVRDEAGNPIKQNNKPVLVEGAISVGANYTESNASAIKNKYIGVIPPQVIEELSVTVPSHQTLIDEALTAKGANLTTAVNFNPQQNPINNQSDWERLFPAPGTQEQPTVVRISNGGLNIPNGIDLAHTVIIVEQGDINFNGSGHNFDNVALIAQNGSINLASVQSDDLSVFATGNININSDARFGGDTLIAMNNGNGSLHFDGATTTLDSSSNLRVVSQGNIIFNSQTDTRGDFTAAKDFTANGRTSLIGSIQVKGNITFNGGVDIISGFDSSDITNGANNEDIIYQFVNTDKSDFGANFYTSDEVEKDYIIDNLHNYQYEKDFLDSTSNLDTEAEEVYRFFNTETGTHFYTTDLVERDSILENLSHFSYEGIAFLSYKTKVQDSVPMYRFYESETGIHFYTSDWEEIVALRDNFDRYIFEGIVYYVVPFKTAEADN